MGVIRQEKKPGSMRGLLKFIDKKKKPMVLTSISAGQNKRICHFT
jgi:hypothetical protein